MNGKPQTAIRGVFSVSLVNLVARFIAYAKHIAITAYIGLSAQLDAFYVATTILGLGIFVFGDVFDSLGIPRLVKSLQEEGETSFRNQAGSFFTFSVLLSIGLCFTLALIASWTPWVAPGFSPEKKEYVIRNLFSLAPMAFLYLPYHAVGSFLRARRRFQVFYIGEVLIASVTLVIILVWHEFTYVIPLSFSAAYIVVFLFIATTCIRDIRFSFTLHREEIKTISRGLFALLPLYLVFHLFILVDRVFASYLPTGGLSALSYGLLISLIPGSIFMMENIFVTPLAESDEKGALLRKILTGVLLISVPVACFTTAYGARIVSAVFERGAFDSSSTLMTGDALSFYALGIPAFIFWPICYRLFQILGKLKDITAIACAAVLLNGILNYMFMEAGFGIRGVALATSISNYALIAGAILLLKRMDIHLTGRKTLGVAAIVVIASGASLLLSHMVPVPSGHTAGVLCRGVVFLLAVTVILYGLPNREIRSWRETVFRQIFTRGGES